MVSLVWLILSLFKVCTFSWWPVFVESIVYTFLFIIVYGTSNNYFAGIASIFNMGVIAFSALKLFAGLTISPWWLLLSGIYFALAFFVPGGFTLTYLWFNHMGVITFSKGQLIFLIVVDLLIVISLVGSIISVIVEKRKEVK